MHDAPNLFMQSVRAQSQGTAEGTRRPPTPKRPDSVIGNLLVGVMTVLCGQYSPTIGLAIDFMNEKAE